MSRSGQNRFERGSPPLLHRSLSPSRIINLQQANGSWVNSNGRWCENDPNLVTAYSVMALEFVYPGL